MIKATELRIGNLFTSQGANGAIGQITDIYSSLGLLTMKKEGRSEFLNPINSEVETCGFQHIAGDYCPLLPVKYLIPIPLTEEWLERMGFVHKFNHNADGDEMNWMEYERRDVIGNNYLCYKDGQINLFHGWLNITPCIFVHDLQNLYFALTGEELAINETA